MLTFTYAIADLHGRFDLLTKAYDAIPEHSDGRRGTIVHLGDYVDRGPQSREIIEWLMDPASIAPGWHRIVLRGNHEDIMVKCSADPGLASRWWLPNCGGKTLLSYVAEVDQDMRDALTKIPPGHVAWLATLPRLYIDQHRVFVHAGVQPSVPLDQQDDEKLGWMIYPTGADGGHGDRHVVHGHQPHRNGPMLYAARTNLDTFAWNTGRLVVGVFDDDKAGGPVDLIEIIGPPAVSDRRVYGEGSFK